MQLTIHNIIKKELIKLDTKTSDEVLHPGTKSYPQKHKQVATRRNQPGTRTPIYPDFAALANKNKNHYT
jgi:hypothetical protein